MEEITRLESQVEVVFDDLEIAPEERAVIWSFLQPLKAKHPVTTYHYCHSLRVGLLAQRIGHFVHFDEKALFYAGLMHDVGKCLTCLGTLGKTDGWTPADSKEMEHHVPDGYRLLRGRFDFSTEILLWHHRFQGNAYPPLDYSKPLHDYSQGTKTMIEMYGRLLALADAYDALHRVNDKFGEKRSLSDDEIKEKMLEFNKDQKVLITNLYQEGILN